MFGRKETVEDASPRLGPPIPVRHATLIRKWYSPKATKAAKPLQERVVRVDAGSADDKRIAALLAPPSQVWRYSSEYEATVTPVRVTIMYADGSWVDHTLGVEEDHTHEILS